MKTKEDAYKSILEKRDALLFKKKQQRDRIVRGVSMAGTIVVMLLLSSFIIASFFYNNERKNVDGDQASIHSFADYSNLTTETIQTADAFSHELETTITNNCNNACRIRLTEVSVSDPHVSSEAIYVDVSELDNKVIDLLTVREVDSDNVIPRIVTSSGYRTYISLIDEKGEVTEIGMWLSSVQFPWEEFLGVN